MEWLQYILIFLALIVVGFVIRRIWIALVDSVFSGIKKLFSKGNNKKEDKNWHTIDEIRDHEK